MTGIARARRYPQPPPASAILAGARCEHGELVGRCAPCRWSADPPDEPEPASPGPPRPDRAALVADCCQQPPGTAAREPGPGQDEPPPATAGETGHEDPRDTPWWQR